MTWHRQHGLHPSAMFHIVSQVFGRASLFFSLNSTMQKHCLVNPKINGLLEVVAINWPGTPQWLADWLLKCLWSETYSLQRPLLPPIPFPRFIGGAGSALKQV
jgi:hypothetical protein